MAQKFSEIPLVNFDQDWGDDKSNQHLPFSGEAVQNFIKTHLSGYIPSLDNPFYYTLSETSLSTPPIDSALSNWTEGKKKTISYKVKDNGRQFFYIYLTNGNKINSVTMKIGSDSIADNMLDDAIKLDENGIGKDNLNEAVLLKWELDNIAQTPTITMTIK